MEFHWKFIPYQVIFIDDYNTTNIKLNCILYEENTTPQENTGTFYQKAIPSVMWTKLFKQFILKEKSKFRLNL